MEIESFNPKTAQEQIAKKLGYSVSALKRYRNDKEMKGPFRSSEIQNGLKRTQTTSQAPAKNLLQMRIVSTKKKSKLKGGSMQDGDRFNAESLDIILH